MNWLFDYIHRLQRLPLEEKKKKAQVIASVLTVIIFLFWISTLAISEKENTSNKEMIDITPLQNIKEAIGDISDSLGKMKDGLRSFGEGVNLSTTTSQVRP